MYQRGGRRGLRGGQRTRGVRLFESPPPAAASSPGLGTPPVNTEHLEPEVHAAEQQGDGHASSSETLPPDSLSPDVDPLHQREGPNVGQPYSSDQSMNEEEVPVYDSEGRLLIKGYGDSFSNGISVVRMLNRIINDHWRGPYARFSNTPDDAKKLWWSQFSRHYYWAEHHENDVRRIFNKKVSDHIRNSLNKARTKQAKPHYISIEDWTEILRIWGTEEHKLVSLRNKRNRASSCSDGAATYAGGSINIGEHKKRLAKELGREPSISQTFERTFKKKDNTYVSEKARAVKEKFDELMANASAGEGDGASDVSVDESALWVDALGGVKRGNVYGLGSLSRDTIRKVVGTSSGGYGTRKSQREMALEQEMRDLKAKLAKKDELDARLSRNMERILQRLNMEDEEEDEEEVHLTPSCPISNSQIDEAIAALRGS